VSGRLIISPARGEILKHDLMSPHVYLRDLARTSTLGDGEVPAEVVESSLPSLLSYVDTLFKQRSSNSGLLSPTTPLTPHTRRSSSWVAEPSTSREAIDLAVMRSNQPKQSKLSTRFTIARSGRPVAIITLPRASYRLGETIHLVVDFFPHATNLPGQNHQGPDALISSTAPSLQIPVHAVLVTLESAEEVDPAIAMRSPQTVYRYTRRVHAQAAESALFSRRLAFALAIPPAATPEFATSGVSLHWRIKVEFVTPRLRARPTPKLDEDEEKEEGGDDDDNNNNTNNNNDSDDADNSSSGGGGGGGEANEDESAHWVEKEWPDLLEQVAGDDRGEILQGVEMCHVETFEVGVPVRIYGSAVGCKDEADVNDVPV
jgi:hypothetical protein